MKLKHLIFVVAAVSAIVLPSMALAQGGCVDSPENPTALLALVGGVSGVITALRARRKS